jgi:hypothetical protein
MRAFLGFVAGALAVLTFHQGLVETLHVLGLAPQAAYRVTPVLPFNVPLIVSLSFWGGVYGLCFGMARTNFRLPLWLSSLCLGLVAALIGMFIVAPLKGNPVAYDGHAWPIARSFLVNGFWGVGVGLILPLLQPRPLMPSSLVRLAASRL